MTKDFKTNFKFKLTALSVAVMSFSSTSAFAEGGEGGGEANNFSSIARNISTSLNDIPGLLSALAYLMGVILGILGVLKIKDHVENPTQTPLKDGAVRLAVGGALFALPILFESMMSTVGNNGAGVDVATLKAADFSVE
ncbi:MAG: hypothetical protein CMH26_06615 [Micavibrio sp.]|nr:hypothetical protein [Micavibrio sp.]|tara:strand:+ start:729 stop:1145 length:417 start_codon:yes stop_codon:yes gene_type:complete